MALDPNAVGDKYKRRTANARPDWEAGIGSVSIAPGSQAAAKADKWEQNTVAAKDRWKDKVGRVSLEEWRSRALAVGGSRYVSGTSEGAQRYTAYMQKAAPIIDSIQKDVASMPDATFEDSLARMTRNATLMRDRLKNIR